MSVFTLQNPAPLHDSLCQMVCFFFCWSLGAHAVVCCSQKAGIFKSGVPALSAPQVPAALAELKRIADAVGAPFWVRELIQFHLLRYFDLAKLRLQPSVQFA